MKKLVFPLAIAAMFIAACNNNSRESESARYMKGVDVAEAPAAPVPSSTDVTKMLREAAMRFRVKEVQEATSVLEKMAISHGGYVAKSMYDIEASETIIKKISTDSAQEIKKLEQRNHMEVFVLNSKLDTFLDKVKNLVDHLEYRHVTAFDVNMEEAFPEEPKAGNQGATSSNNLNYQFASPAPTSSKLRKKFARVTMDFYQTPVIRKWTIPNPDSFEVARGGFWDDFVSSLKTGWRGTAVFFNYLISFWPLWLLAAALYLWLRRRKKTLGIKNIFAKNQDKPAT